MITTFISDRKTDCRIIIPDVPSAVEETAANELQSYLAKAFGVCVPIAKEDGGKGFYIGHTGFAVSRGVLGKSRENWIIKEADGNLILTGGTKNTDRGIVYAVYHFLEDIVGVRWWTRFEEDVPHLTELSLPKGFKKEGTPAFYYRKILSHKHVPDFFYEARCRGNVIMPLADLPDGFYDKSLHKLGGALRMGKPNHVHTLGLYFPAEEYFDKHPEWFALSGAEGKRVTYGHYCLTNEEYINAITEKLLGFIKEDRKIAEECGIEPPVFYSLSFPDASNGFCDCEKCKKAVEKSGASGYALGFVNSVARAVAKVYPDVKIETLIYSVYLDKPKDNTLPEKNVIIRLAQVFADIIHPIHHKANSWYLSLLKDWSEICKKSGSDLYIWEYMYQLFFDVPAPVANRLGDTFRTFYECGVKGIFVENQTYSADFWELNLYLLHHLCEDPYADADALISGFIKRFYGKAAPFVQEYYGELVRSSLENPSSVYCVIESAHFNFLDLHAAKRGMALLQKALEAVSGDDIKTLRVRHLQTLLISNLLVKFDDFKRHAKELGTDFSFNKKALCDTVTEGFEAEKARPKTRPDLDGRFDEAIEYFSNISLEEDAPPLPKEVSGENPKDVYRFFFKNTCRHLSKGLNGLYGSSIEKDDASSAGAVLRLGKDKTTTMHEFITLTATERGAKCARGINFDIIKDGKRTGGTTLYKEDIVPDKYHLYKIGSVSGIRSAGDTRLDIFEINYEWINLSGISVLFPMDKCDIYLCMKFEGEMYGGKKDNVQAVYLDYALIVRKQQ